MRQSKQKWNQILERIEAVGKGWLLAVACTVLTVLLLPLTAKAADSNLYALQVTTGVSDGSGITYFAVVYQDTAGQERTEYVFPNNGDYQRDLRRAAEIGVTDRAENLKKDFHYIARDWSTQKPLQPYQTDTYFITPRYEMDHLLRVDVFAGNKDGAGAWSCQGMQFYQVRSVRGLEYYGYLSDQYYTRFSGTLLAELQNADGAGSYTFTWTGRQQLSLPLEGDTAADQTVKLVSRDAAYQSDAGTTYYLKLDVADVYQGGIEALASEVSDNRAGLTDLGLCEAMALTVQYVDSSGSTRVFTMPVLLSAMEWAIHEKNISTTAPLAGVAQQGEQILLPVKLPGLKSISKMTLQYGHANAVAAAGLGTGSLTQRQKTRIDILDNQKTADSVSLTGVSLYDASVARPELSADSGFLQCTLNNSVPTDFYTATTPQGRIMKAKDRWEIPLKAYQKGDLLTPQNTTKQYLVSIQTDTAASAGTTADLILHLSYQTLSGNEAQTDAINVRERATDFYGYWPNSAGRTNIAYLNGVSAGGTLQFLVTLNNVNQFTGASFSMYNSGNDDWQMLGMQIYELTSLSTRRVTWESVSAGGMTSDRVYSRDFQGTEMIVLKDKKALLQEGTNQELTFDSKDIPAQPDNQLNWSDISYSMTYEQAHQNLGFTQNRATYTVAVKVASDQVSDAVNGDCGSKNHFYFQLVFENGVSAYVLANQQLTADAFRAGQEETFQISTNQNYGELTAVRIIPDDISDSSDIYDKLKIEEIAVRKSSDGAMSQQWKIKNLDNDGWVGIDYRDDGAADSITGQSGRSQEELARTYRVTESSYAMNILFCVATAAYTNGMAQFQGTMTGTLSYYNRNGQLKTMNFDAVQAMYAYNNRSATSVDRNGNAQSDPNLMFRGGHMDRFILSVDDVSRLVGMTFSLTSPVATQWNVESVTASLIQTGGVLLLNTNNEYERSGETEALCQQTESKSPAYSVVVNANATQQETIYFTEKEISINTETNTWTTVVSRLPSGTEDTLNIYAYLRSDADQSGYVLNAAAQYTNIYGVQYQISAQQEMTPVEGENGVFICTDLPVKGMSLLTGVTLEADNSQASVYVDHVIVNRVRQGVVIGTYYLNFGGSNVAMRARTVAPAERENLTTQHQKVTMQLGAGTESTALLAENRDLAVSIKYTSTNDYTDIEYDSPYIYLTDQEVASIREGQIIELNFQQPYVKEITGISMISTGGLIVHVDRAYAATYENENNECSGWYSFADGVTLSGSAHTLRPTDIAMPTEDDPGNSGTVTDVTMTFVTQDANSMMESGLDSAVALTVGYHPYQTTQSTVRSMDSISDLRKYIISGGSGFTTGSTVQVRMLLSDLEEVRWLELEPQRGSDANAGWSLEKFTLDAVTGQRSQHMERAVNQRIYTGKITRIGISNIHVEVTVNGETYINQAAKGVLAESGSSLSIGVQVTGSSQGFTARAAEIDLTSGAEKDANAYLTTEGDTVRFAPPKNERDANVTYRITIASEEQPDVACTVDFTVQYEIKPPVQQETSEGGGGGGDSEADASDSGDSDSGSDGGGESGGSEAA